MPSEETQPNISQLQLQCDIPGLIEILKHEDYKVRSEAKDALQRITDPRAVEPLITAALEASYPLQLAVEAPAVYALARIGTPRAREGILLVLRKYNDEARNQYDLASIIAGLRAASSQIFLEALKDPLTRTPALWALGNALVGDKGLPHEEPWPTNFRPIIDWLLDTIANVQVKRGADPWDASTNLAINALAAIGDGRCLPPLETLLERVREVGNVRAYVDLGHARGWTSTHDKVRYLEASIDRLRARVTL